MDNNISPDKNFHSKEKKEALGEEIFMEVDDINDDSDDTTNNENNNIGQDQFRKKMMSLFLIVFGVLIAILVIGYIVSIFFRKTYTYSELEDVIEDAAISYFADNKGKLPKSQDEIVEITTSTLISNKYMKEMNKYVKNDACGGKVSVTKVSSNEYSYIPYLSCGKEYTTERLIDKIKNDKELKDGYGVYNLNGEYVYRGGIVNNYLKFNDNDNLFRIVKVNKDDEIVIIDEDGTNNTFMFDDRYNNATEDKSGINDFRNSAMSNYLEQLYKNKFDSSTGYFSDEKKLLTKKDKTRLVEFNSCIGKRSELATSKDSSVECSTIYKTKLSLLPVSDFLNASLDKNCVSTLKKDCQNYNYLASDYGYWLANGSSEESSKIFIVSDYVVSAEASSDYQIRAIAHLSSNVIVVKGKGTEKNPYIIK